MSVLTAVILGLVQGIAEFLPISSSGHLAIAEHLLNMQGASNVPDFFDVLLHLGTLVAVFLSTSDEAVPVLLANPGGWQEVLRLLLVKLVVAMGAGFLLDLFWNRSSQDAAFAANAETHVCKSDSKFSHILLAAVRRTLEIFQYLFLFSLALGLLISLIGEEKLSALLLPGPFQPLIAALVGLIPNCAASVLLTQLYLDGMISFGSAIAGLCSSAGIGLLVLLRGKRGARASGGQEYLQHDSAAER